MTATEEAVEHIGESKGIANHDHDMAHELSQRLDAVWRRLLLGLVCLMAPPSGVGAIIHTESSIFRDSFGGGEARVDLEIEDFGATRTWRYKITNLSFDPPLGRDGLEGGIELVQLFFPYPDDNLEGTGAAVDVSAPARFGHSNHGFPGNLLEFLSNPPGLRIGDEGLFAFTEVKFIGPYPSLSGGSLAPLGPHQIVRSNRLFLGDADEGDFDISLFNHILDGFISVPGDRVVLPEPSTLPLCVLGLSALIAVRARHHRRRGGDPDGKGSPAPSGASRRKRPGFQSRAPSRPNT